jgi:large subunit ribosomal protein L12
MQYIYAALLLHSSGKKIDEEHVKKVMEAAGDKPEEARAQAAAAQVVAAPASVSEAKSEAKEEKKEDESKKAEEAVAGLSSLFG